MLQSNEYIFIKNNKKLWGLIKNNESNAISNLRLQYPDISIPTANALFELKKVYEKLHKKLPSWSKNEIIMPLKAFQQCTTERVALFKSSLFSGNLLIDFSGGIGMDDWAFSPHFKNIISFDTDLTIHECALHNIAALGIENIERRWEDGTQIIQDLPKFDLAYIDPDRKSHISKGVAIADMTPNLAVCIPQLWNKTDKILLKLSPLFDIQMILNVWRETSKIWVIADKNDVKEVAVLLEKDFQGNPVISTINLDKQDFKYSVVWDGVNVMKIEQTTHLNEYNYVVFPFHALTKSNLADDYFGKMGLKKLSNTAFYTSEKKQEITGGNKFQVTQVLKGDVKSVKKYISKNSDFRASLIVKGLKINAIDWKKKIGLKEGGKDIILLLKNEIGVKVYILSAI